MPIILFCTDRERHHETLGVYDSKEEVAARIKNDEPHDIYYYYILTSWEETVILAKYEEVDYEKISDNKYLCIPRLKRKWCENEEEMREFEQFDQGREEREQWKWSRGMKQNYLETSPSTQFKNGWGRIISTVLLSMERMKVGEAAFKRRGEMNPFFSGIKKNSSHGGKYRKYNEQENRPLPRNGPCDKPTV